jgi:hypothetical protein
MSDEEIGIRYSGVFIPTGRITSDQIRRFGYLREKLDTGDDTAVRQAETRLEQLLDEIGAAFKAPRPTPQKPVRTKR